jgi:hypothetical protein
MSGVKVLHLLAQAAGRTDVAWGETHAAHGLGLAFCYVRGQFAAPFFSNIDLPHRAASLLGCRFEATWTDDPEAAWAFIRSGLDSGSPVKMAGPEDSVVYACEDADEVTARRVFARGVGGPALEGAVSWEAFAEWVPRWVPLGGGGMYYPAGLADRPCIEDFVTEVARRVVEWQEHHPGAGRLGDPSNYGVSALEQFLADLLQPEINIPDEYIDCISINFQYNARAALADYFADVAGELGGRQAELVEDVAGAYRSAALNLERYARTGTGGRRGTEASRKQISETVGAALEAERQAFAAMAALAGP